MKRPTVPSAELSPNADKLLRTMIGLWLDKSKLQVGCARDEAIHGIIELIEAGVARIICDKDPTSGSYDSFRLEVDREQLQAIIRKGMN